MMADGISEWLDDAAWADIERMRQPKPVRPVGKRVRYADMTAEQVKRKQRNKKKWMDENHERMVEYWKLYRKRHRDENHAACAKWQKKFRQEHGVCYQTWRRWRNTPEGRERIAAWEKTHRKEPQ